MLAKVVIIDDDEEIAEVTKLILEEHEYQVQTGHSKEDLLRLLETHTPDLIIMDIWLDKQDGNGLAEMLKTNPQTAHIPIILFSALNMTNAVSTFADDLLRKPYDMDVLLELAAKHTYRKKLDYVNTAP